ncbi:ParB N-terminal domain-containing protein [Sphingobium sp. SA2]|uniref:ParB N-terminal domain-containing protein n=1 Tax=Sphingobium sp. SA2 TaxID=1524832 RepID=UPI0028C2239F|nr:ParB N-terminal domain-containing protein [Sphingobium sp. SA2]MDT7533767.1 ParB N-terminal domain-containing protein [Sphingobium sp. SA2]
MATAAKMTADISAPVLSISPHDVLVGERLGAFWPDKAAAIGKLMAEDGQNEPIKVRASGPRAAKPWTLVAGHHRLEGAMLAGLVLIDAIEVTGDEATLRKIEASENVERGSRSPIERACFVRAIADAAEARIKSMHGDLSPEQIAIRARWDAMKAKAPGVERDDDLNDAEAEHTSANLALVYGWADATSEALGLSRRAMFRDLALHRALVAPFPTLYRALATHPQVGENASALREIAAIGDISTRRALIEGLIDAPDMTLAEAKEGLGLTKPSAAPATGATKFMNNAASNLARLSASQQRDFVPALLKAIKPSVLNVIAAEIAAMKAGGQA